MLFRLLGIRPAERRDAIVGFSMLLALMAGHAVLETARDTLFLARLPASFLPWAYLAMALLTLLAVGTNRGILARFSRRRALSLSLFVGASINVGFFALSSLAGSAGSLLAFYIWTGLFATVVVVQFWLLLGEVLDLSQAKRVFAWIGAGGLLGATLGSALAGAILLVFPAQTLLVVAAALFLASAFMPAFFSRSGRLAASPDRRAPRDRGDSNFALLRADGYLRRLLWLVLVGTLMVTGIDYVFKAVVAAEVPASELGAFFSRYYALMNGLALLVQIVIAPQLLRNLGVNRALLIMPVLLLLAAGGFVFSAGLASAVVLKGVDGSLRHSVNRTAMEILYLPLSARTRQRFKAFIEALGQRGGQALASLGILAAIFFEVHPRDMAWALFALGALWLLGIVGLKPYYLELFRRQLRAGTIETRVDVAELDLHTLEALFSALTSDDDIEVIAALDMFEAYNKTRLISALILFHPSRAVVLKAYELFADSDRKDLLRLSVRSLRHPDHEIRAAALRHYSAHEDPKALEAPLRRCLQDESPACRATAAVGLIAAGLIDGGEAQSVLTSILDGPSADARQALALSLRQLPAERYAWVAARLAACKQPGLAPLVASSIAAAPGPEHLPILLLLLAQREGRGEARQALHKLGNPALDYLEHAMSDHSLPRTVRRHLPRTISCFGTARAASILMGFLPTERDEAVRYKILRGLGRMRADDPAIPMDRELLLDWAQRMLERSITVLSWRLVTDSGRAKAPHLDTAAAELLSALLRDYETSALERVFRLLHIIEPSEEFAMIYDGLRSAAPTVRAGSRELLEHVVPTAVRDGILAMVDDAPSAERLLNAAVFYDMPSRTQMAEIAIMFASEDAEDQERALVALGQAYATCLQEMLHDHSGVLRSVVSYHIAELGLDTLRDKVASAEVAERNSLSELRDRALDVLHDPTRLELRRA